MLHIEYPLEKLNARPTADGTAVEIAGEVLGLNALAEKLFGDAPLEDRDAWRVLFYWVEENSSRRN